MGAVETLRDALFGNPPSPTMEPSREGVLAAFVDVVSQIANVSLGASTSVVVETRALLNADLAHDAGSIGLVWNDPVDANNDLYVKIGASGTGSWQNTGALHDTLSGLAYPYILEAIQAANQAAVEAAAAANSAAAAAASKGEALAAAIAASNARTAAEAAAQAKGYRPTIAQAITDFAVGDYFYSDDQGAVTSHPNELRIYKRIAGSPYYQDQGDDVAPLTKQTYLNGATRLTTRTGLPTLAVGGTAYAVDIDAMYDYDAGSSATADGWGVIAALGGVGRWLLVSDAVTVHASGGDDAPTLMAAGNVMAALGKKLITPDPLYLLSTKWVFGRAPVHVIANRGVEFRGGLTPDGQVATACFYCSAGGDAIVATSAIAASNTVGSETISIDDEPDVGHYVRIRDDVSGAQGPTPGFTGSTYRVVAVSGSGPYIVTVDRPVLFPVADGDECVIFSDIAKGHIIEGFPTISGTGTRLFEFVGTMHCRVEAIFRPDTLSDAVASFDLFGFDNHFMPGTECHENGSGATDGLYLESQESSSITAKVRGFASGEGVSIFHGIDCTDYSEVSGCNVGGTLKGYGSYGCIGSTLAGRYEGNIAQGASITNGSRDCSAIGTGRYNPINLAVGDPSGGNVKRTHVEGDWSNASNIGIWVNATAIGTMAGLVDTSDCNIGILGNGDIEAAIQRHHGTTDASNTGGCVVATDSAKVTIGIPDYDIEGAENIVRTSGTAVVHFPAGRINGGAGSNLLRPGGSSKILLGNGFVGTTDDGTGNAIYFDSTTAKVVMDRATDLSGISTIAAGSKGFVRDGRVSTNISDNATTAVATQEILKEYTFPTASLEVGKKIRIRAWGVVAANANSKTVQMYFGPSGGSLTAVASASVGTGAAFAWYFETEIWLTGSATQDYVTRVNNGNNAQVVRGALTKDITSALQISLRGTNGTASAGDIVARGLEVEVMA